MGGATIQGNTVLHSMQPMPDRSSIALPSEQLASFSIPQASIHSYMARHPRLFPNFPGGGSYIFQVLIFRRGVALM